MTFTTPRAAVILIGNEILSGKTQDKNLSYLGIELASIGIRVERALVIRDETETIARAVNECRQAYDYVFTTGGIGPTHDDITSASVAVAFGVELIEDPEALRRLTSRYGGEVTPARRKMAQVPAGARLIDNDISQAPGFQLENVFVLAGIPEIARAMFESLKPELTGGPAIHSLSIDAFLSEGQIASALGEIDAEFPRVDVGSYPFMREGRFGVNVVARSTELSDVEAVIDRVEALMKELGASPVRRQT